MGVFWEESGCHCPSASEGARQTMKDALKNAKVRKTKDFMSRLSR
jgi:hypothetical protein